MVLTALELEENERRPRPAGGQGRRFDGGTEFGYPLMMTDNERQLLERIIAYCDARWVEADKASDAPYPTPDTQLGKKMAYSDLMHYARSLLSESEPPAPR
jgi:hypothetical protein